MGRTVYTDVLVRGYQNVGYEELQDNARLDVAGGDSGIAPFKIGVGGLTTVPRPGAIENVGDDILWTDSYGVRHSLLKADSTVDNSLDELMYSKASIVRKEGYMGASEGWYRIATTKVSIGVNEATIRFYEKSYDCIFAIKACISKNHTPTIAVDVLSGLSEVGVTKVRLVYTTGDVDGYYAYLEVYKVSEAPMYATVESVEPHGWELLPPVIPGGVPDDFLTKEITLVEGADFNGIAAYVVSEAAFDGAYFITGVQEPNGVHKFNYDVYLDASDGSLNSLKVNTETLSVVGDVTADVLRSGVVHGDDTGLLYSGTVLLDSEVEGILPVMNGGTGRSSITAGALVYGNGTGVASILGIGSNNYVLVSNGSAPTWAEKAPNATNASKVSIASSTAKLQVLGVATNASGNSTIYKDTSVTIEGGTVTATTFSGSLSGGTVSCTTLTASSTVTFSGLGSGVVHSNSSGVLSVANVNLANEVTGTLPVERGGTGATTFTAYRLLVGNGVSAVSALGQATSNYVLVGNGNSAVPTWQEKAPKATDADNASNVGVASTSAKLYVTGVLTTASGNSAVYKDQSVTVEGGTITATTFSGSLNGGSISGTTLTVSSTATFSGLGTGVAKLTNGVLSAGNVDLATSEVTGILGATHGGTGVATVAKGDLLYGSASNTWNRLAIGGTSYAGRVLYNTGTLPEWKTLSDAGIATKDHNHDGTYLKLAGGESVTGLTTFTNGLTVSGGNLTANAGIFTSVKVGGGALLKYADSMLNIRNSADSDWASVKMGNLTVEGTITYINTQDLNVADNIITLNSDVTGTPSENGGIEIKRGTSTNASLLWDESNDVWKCGLVGSESIIVTAANYTDYVKNGNLYLQANGSGVATFTANQSGNTTLNIGTGSSNGTISVGGSDVAVKGLGSNAYSSTAYLPLAGLATVTGLTTFSGGLHIEVQEGTYVSGMTQTKTITFETTSSSSSYYYPYLRGLTYGNHVWNWGGYQNLVGVWGYFAGRTANSYDWRTVWDVSTGNLTHTKGVTVSGIATFSSSVGVASALTVGTTLSVTGATTLTGNLTANGISTIADLRPTLLTLPVVSLPNTTVSGRIENDGSYLYYTDSGLTRHKLLFAEDNSVEIAAIWNDLDELRFRAMGERMEGTLPAVVGWYRIATLEGRASANGLFRVSDILGGSEVLFSASVGVGSNGSLVQIGGSGTTISKVRIAYSGAYAFLEIYNPTVTARLISVEAIGQVGWRLTPGIKGGAPTNYNIVELTFHSNALVANYIYGDGSNLTNVSGGSFSGVLSVTHGGTGMSSFVAGDLLYASSTDTFVPLGIGSTATILYSNGVIPSWRTPNDAGIVIKAGSIWTGVMTAWGSQYTDSRSGALNMNNSNIYGVNSVIFADKCDNSAEGLQWYRDTTTVDSVWVKDGVMYLTPNRTFGSTGTDYVFLHTGNWSDTITMTSIGMATWAQAANKPTYTLDEVSDGTTRKLTDYIKKDGSVAFSAAWGRWDSNRRGVYRDLVNWTSGSSNSFTGAIKIKVGAYSSTMRVIRITLYNYKADNSSGEIIVSGYTYTTNNQWTKTTVFKSTNNLPSVKLTCDGSNFYIILGAVDTAWSYNVSLAVDEMANYTVGSTERTAWSAELITTEPTWTNYVTPSVNVGFNADTVDGAHVGVNSGNIAVLDTGGVFATSVIPVVPVTKGGFGTSSLLEGVVIGITGSGYTSKTATGSTVQYLAWNGSSYGFTTIASSDLPAINTLPSGSTNAGYVLVVGAANTYAPTWTEYAPKATDATNASKLSVVKDTSNTLYLLGVTTATATAGPKSVVADTSISFKAGIITATTFSGDLSGTATNANNVNITASTSKLYVTGVLTTASGNSVVYRDENVYVQGGKVGATTFVGYLNGNADSADYATSAGSATSAGTATTATNVSGGTVSCTTLTASSTVKFTGITTTGLLTITSGTVGVTTLLSVDYLPVGSGSTQVAAGNHGHLYALSSSDGGSATYVNTTSDTANTLYVTGVQAGATTSLKYDSSVTVAGGTITATTGAINKIFVGTTSTVKATGVSFWQTPTSGRPDWQIYMANASTTACGVNAKITAPSGTYVTGYALRSVIQNTANYGWTWEKCASTANTTVTPTIVAELRNDGIFKAAGFVGAGTSITNLNADNLASGVVAIGRGGFGTTTGITGLIVGSGSSYTGLTTNSTTTKYVVWKGSTSSFDFMEPETVSTPPINQLDSGSTQTNYVLVVGGSASSYAPTWVEKAPNATNADKVSITSSTSKLHILGVATNASGNSTIYKDTSVYISGGTIGATTFSGDLSGNATTASAWKNGRTITLTGGVTGTSASWTGSGNLSITTTLSSHQHAVGDITGILPIANGGTGSSSATAYRVLAVNSDASAYTTLGGATSNYVLVGNGANSLPTWAEKAPKAADADNASNVSITSSTAKLHILGVATNASGNSTVYKDTSVYVQAGTITATTFSGDLSGTATNATYPTVTGVVTTGTGSSTSYYLTGVDTFGTAGTGATRSLRSTKLVTWTGAGALSAVSMTVTGLSSGVVRSTSGVLGVGSVSLESEVSGTLPIGNGGIGTTSLTKYAVLLGNGTGVISSTAVGTNNYVLIGKGNAFPTWAEKAPKASVADSCAGVSTADTSANTQALLDAFITTGVFQFKNFSNASSSWGDSYPGISDGLVYSCGYTNGYGFQLAVDDDNTHKMFLRNYSGGSNATWNAWKQIVMGDGTGAGGTWSINISGNAATATYPTVTGVVTTGTGSSTSYYLTGVETFGTAGTGATRVLKSTKLVTWTGAGALSAVSLTLSGVKSGVMITDSNGVVSKLQYSSGTSGQVLALNDAGTGVTWVNQSSGGTVDTNANYNWTGVNTFSGSLYVGAGTGLLSVTNGLVAPVSSISYGYVSGIVGSGANQIAAGNHTHAAYINKDGSVSFTNPYGKWDSYYRGIYKCLAVYRGSGTQTGQVQVKVGAIAIATSTSYSIMRTIRIVVFDKNADNSGEVVLSGYIAQNMWNKVNVFKSNPNMPDVKVIYSTNTGDIFPYVLIGSTSTSWSYVYVAVLDDIINTQNNNSLSSTNTERTGWSVTVSTTAKTGNENTTDIKKYLGVPQPASTDTDKYLKYTTANGLEWATVSGGTGGGATVLTDLGDVSISSPGAYALMYYDSSASKWKNLTAPSTTNTYLKYVTGTGLTWATVSGGTGGGATQLSDLNDVGLGTAVLKGDILWYGGDNWTNFAGISTNSKTYILSQTKTSTGGVSMSWTQTAPQASTIYAYGISGTSGNNINTKYYLTGSISNGTGYKSLYVGNSGRTYFTPAGEVGFNSLKLNGNAGTAGQVLMVNSDASGVIWGTPSGGGSGVHVQHFDWYASTNATVTSEWLDNNYDDISVSVSVGTGTSNLTGTFNLCLPNLSTVSDGARINIMLYFSTPASPTYNLSFYIKDYNALNTSVIGDLGAIFDRAANTNPIVMFMCVAHTYSGNKKWFVKNITRNWCQNDTLIYSDDNV